MKVAVRWFDGYLQVFDNVEEWRAGSHLLWVRQKQAARHGDVHTERHIPLLHVRWFSPNPTDRKILELKMRDNLQTPMEKE